MRWLTKLFRSPAPLRPQPAILPARPTWLRARFEARAWDGERCLVHFPSQSTTTVLPHDLVDFAEHCDSSLSWEEHQENFARRCGISSRELGPELENPETCARLGLIEPASALRESLAAPSTPPPPLACVGIVSHGNPDLTHRCAQSLAGHMRLHGRTVPALGVDPASDAAASGPPFPMLQRQGGEAMATWLAAACGADPVAVRQALAHADNALLALAAGQPFLRVDDVVEFELQDLSPRPGHLVAGASWHPYQYRVGLDLARPVREDFLAALERLLGQPVGAVLALHPAAEFSALDQNGRQRLHHPQATVRMAMAGAWGDPVGGLGGAAPPLHPALAPGFSFHPQTHEAWMTSRFLHQCALAAALTGPGPVGAGAAALDARVLLPPVPPGLSLQSGCFTSCLWQFRPEAWIGHAPLALARVPLQLPPGATAFARLDPSGPWTCPPRALWQHLLQHAAPPRHLADPAQRLEWSGAALASLTTPPTAFRDLLHTALCQILQSTLAEALTCRDAFRLPAAAVAMDQYLHRLEAASANPLAALPPLPSKADAAEAWRTQASGFAALCQGWPSLWKIAASESLEVKVARFTGSPRP